MKPSSFLWRRTALVAALQLSASSLSAQEHLYQFFVWMQSGEKTGYLFTEDPYFVPDGDVLHFHTRHITFDIPRDQLDRFTIEEVLPEYIEELHDCNAIFLLSHCGYEADRETAARFPQLDAIFGGHSHTRVGEDGKQMVNGVLVTQAEAKVKFLTLSTFTFRDGKVVDVESELLSITNFPKRNEKVQAMVDDYNSNEYFRTVLTQNLAAVDNKESLGCLMTDAIRYTTGSDMGFQNPGGVRFDTLSARPVTLKDIFALDPFDNEIIAYTLSGQEIINLMKSCFVTDRGPIFCSGCSYQYKVDDNGEMTDIVVTLENGKPLDMKAKYNIVMNSYMAAVFDYEHEDEGHSTFRSSNDLMLEYLSQHPEIDYSTVTRVTEE